MPDVQRIVVFTILLIATNLVDASATVQEGFFGIENNAPHMRYHTIRVQDENSNLAPISYSFEAQSAWVFSGLPNGQYHIELLGDEEAHSLERVTVSHHDISKAFALFTLGFIMFAALVLRLMTFAKDHGDG